MSNPAEKCPLSLGMIESILDQVDILDEGMELAPESAPATAMIIFLGCLVLLWSRCIIMVIFRWYYGKKEGPKLAESVFCPGRFWKGGRKKRDGED